MNYLLSALLFFIPTASSAALPPARFIASQLVKNSGQGVYKIEQDIQFPSTGEPLVVRETWWVQNDRTFKLQVVGLRELKEQFQLQYVYQKNQRFEMGGKKPKNLKEDFFEKYFHFRSSERLLDELVSLELISPQLLNRKSWRSVKDIDYKPEAGIRLSRVGGVVCYAYGTPSPVDGDPNPGFWIEQDNFALRKIRLPSQVEIAAEKFVVSPKGLLFPRERSVRWGPSKIEIQTISVAPQAGLKPDFFDPSSLNIMSRMEGIENPMTRTLVEEFYSRFR